MILAESATPPVTSRSSPVPVIASRMTPVPSEGFPLETILTTATRTKTRFPQTDNTAGGSTGSRVGVRAAVCLWLFSAIIVRPIPEPDY